MENVEKLLKDFDIANLDSYETMIYNDLIKHSTKEETLQILINTVEGDFSQLSDGLAEIAYIQENNF